MSNPVDLTEITLDQLRGLDHGQLVKLLAGVIAGDAPADPPITLPDGTALGGRMPLADYFDKRYRIVRPLSDETIREYHNVIRGFARWLKRTPSIADLALRVNDYLYARSKDVSVQSLKKYRAHFCAVLKLAAEDGLVKFPKVARFTPPDHVVKALLPDELVKLVEATYRLGTDGLFARAAILLAYDSGARRRDVFSLTWENLDEATGVLTWIVHKTQRIQTAAVRPVTVQAFHALRPKAMPGDNRLIPFRGDHWGWMRLWRRLGKAAGVDTYKRGLQAIRRTGASLVHAAGENPSRYLGHAPSSLHLFDKFYKDQRIAKPPTVAPQPLHPAIPTPHASLTHATPIADVLGEFLADVDESLPRPVLTFVESTVREWSELADVPRLGYVRHDSAKQYASLLHHDGFDNRRVGLKLQALGRFLTWLVEQRGCSDPDVIECWKSTIRTDGYWRPPTAHPAREQTY